MSRDKKRDEVKDRLAGRFDDMAEDDQDNQDDQQYTVKQDNLEKPDKQDKTDNLNNVENQSIDPKEDWTGRMVFVPTGEVGTEDLLDAFDGEYDRFQYECDWAIQKQLHYYPVLITHGIRELEEMDGEEFTEVVDELGLRS